eukprot:361763-Chlamydomonas_euryale.AAC.1
MDGTQPNHALAGISLLHARPLGLVLLLSARCPYLHAAGAGRHAWPPPLHERPCMSDHAWANPDAVLARPSLSSPAPSRPITPTDPSNLFTGHHRDGSAAADARAPTRPRGATAAASGERWRQPMAVGYPRHVDVRTKRAAAPRKRGRHGVW